MNTANPLSHLNTRGEARMVDVSEKQATSRTATACASIKMQPSTLKLIIESGHPKGDVLATARIAGIMAAKKTPELIPLCHPLMLSKVEVDLTADESLPGIVIHATCKLAGQTGVEMEALTAASVAALTVYDMCKAVDKRMTIQGIRVLEKKGGKSGDWDFSNEEENSIPTAKQANQTTVVIPPTAEDQFSVHFFAELREQLGVDKLLLTLTSLPNPSLADLLAQLRSRDKQWDKHLANKNLLMAVNQQMVKPSYQIKAGDEVAFFPPVTGG